MNSKILSLILLFILFNYTKAQNLIIGSAEYGGVSDNGVLFEFNPLNSSYNVSHQFMSTIAGANPTSGLLYNGTVAYGVNPNGGAYNKGVIYNFNPTTKSFGVIHEFQNLSMGQHPSSDLVSDGTFLYGVTQYGGSNNKGIIFKINISTKVFTKLYDFGVVANDGEYPSGKLVFLNDIIYGTTIAGGLHGYGTVYSFNILNDLFTKDYDFDSNSGSGKKSGVILSNGNLYGVAENGGVNGLGTIYKFDINNGFLNDITPFDTSTGRNPQSIIYENGLFYGVSQNGGTATTGNIFSFEDGINTITSLYEFTDGTYPKSGLIVDNNLLFGTTSMGGLYNDGILFKYDLGNSTFTKEVDFNDSTRGRNPSVSSFTLVPKVGKDLLTGPHAPNLSGQALDGQIILSLNNIVSSNNFNETYSEIDASIPGDQDQTFSFQGYQIFQVRDENVTIDELFNPNFSRLVTDSDLIDAVEGPLINFEFNPVTNNKTQNLKTISRNSGIERSVHITTDLFNNSPLVNGQSYYFIAIAYATNAYRITNGGPSDETYGYLPSKFNAANMKILPVEVIPEIGNYLPSSNYNDGVEITRIEGQGNGGLSLDFTTTSENDIVTNYLVDHPIYQAGKGPVNIKVIDPVKLPEGNFSFKMMNGTNGLDDATWEIEVLNNVTDGYGNPIAAGTIYTSDSDISMKEEQLIEDLGISVTIGQIVYEINGADRYTLPIESSLVYTNSSAPWLSGIKDRDENSPYNWIRSGTTEDPNPPNDIYNDYLGVDDDEVYENILGGWWSPWRLVADEPGGPVGPIFANTIVMPDIGDIHSVDIVFTSDMSKWTRCAVIEMQENSSLSEGNANKSFLRASPSVDKFGMPDGTGTIGMGWFPGYAIDLETGERLNMAFGEDSFQVSDNGRDMIWNPTENITTNPIVDDNSYIFGGRHYIYVFNNDARITGDNSRMPAYDEGVYLQNRLNGGSGDKIRVWRSTMWVGLPVLTPGETLLSNDTRIRLRVEKPYESYETSITQVNASLPLYEFSTMGLGACEIEHVTDTVTACNSYTWLDGVEYTANNFTAIFREPGAAANGCDRIRTLNLTITPVDVSVNQIDNFLIANATNATYQWLDCDNGSTPITGATGQVFTATINGNYAVEITQNGCTITSSCFSVTSIPNILLNLTIGLQGAYINPNVGEETLMRDDLRVGNHLPVMSPYADNLTCDMTVFNDGGASGSGAAGDNIVDWVWIELREANDNTKIIGATSALIQRDGDIVTIDGISPLGFNLPPDNYFIVAKHRSHLGVITLNPVSISRTSTVINFTDSSIVLFGNNSQTAIGVSSGAEALWAGDAISDGNVRFSGTDNDTNQVKSLILNATGNILGLPTFAFSGYHTEDLNMDGIARFSSTNNDSNTIKSNVINHPTNILGLLTFIITEQLP